MVAARNVLYRLKKIYMVIHNEEEIYELEIIYIIWIDLPKLILEPKLILTKIQGVKNKNIN